MRLMTLAAAAVLSIASLDPASAETDSEQVFQSCVSTSDPATCFVNATRSLCPSQNKPDTYDLGCMSKIGSGVSKLIRSCLSKSLQSTPPIKNFDWSIVNGSDFGTAVHVTWSGLFFRIYFTVDNEYIPWSSLVISPSTGKIYIDGEPVNITDAAKSNVPMRPAVVEQIRRAHVLGLFVSPGSYYRDMTPDRYVDVPAEGFFANYEKLEQAFETCGYRVNK